MEMETVTPHTDDLAALSVLEQKIQRVIHTVKTLQQEKAAWEAEKRSLVDEVKAAYAHKDAALREAADLRTALTLARAEAEQARQAAAGPADALERMKTKMTKLEAERQQVRARLEKLLGQMDLLAQAGGGGGA